MAVAVAPREDERNAVAAFPAVRLVAPVNVGRIVPFPVYLIHVDIAGATVVGGKHHDRIVILPDLLQLLVDPSDDVVDHHHQVAVIADRRFPFEFRAGEQRNVGRCECHVEEERLVGILVVVEVVEHLIREVRLHALRAPVAVTDTALDPVQPVAGVFEPRIRLFFGHVVDHIEVRGPRRRGQPVEVIESFVGGSVGHALRKVDVVDVLLFAFLVGPVPAQVPFADDCRRVVAGPEHVGNGLAAFRDHRGRHDAQHASFFLRTPVVAPCEDRITRRGGER